MADPIRDTPKKSVDYGKMSCRIRQITHPEEFDQEIINLLPALLIPIYLFISCLQNWNEDC